MDNVVLILGAGATIAEYNKKSKKNCPPTDKGFFDSIRNIYPEEVGQINNYFLNNYGYNIFSENDSLEKIFVSLYSDSFHLKLGDDAFKNFRLLIKVFNKRIAKTTNNLPVSRKSCLYRIISNYLKRGIPSKSISIITFNYDIQIEKVLSLLNETKRYNAMKPIFEFPACYRISFDPSLITNPTSNKTKCFKTVESTDSGIRILKLHGSLNWYSGHYVPDPSKSAIFNPKRRVWLTKRMTINPGMHLTGAYRVKYTLPLVIPPVNQKSGIFHNVIRSMWNIAESDLKKATEILIFGYSCPELDFESINMIQRSLTQNRKYDQISIIDPDPTLVARYTKLIQPSKVDYYTSAKNYLDNL
ncbi:hypothetical protein GOV13_03165 [Candidatus Pacearchaeota archaeon]|nr:hypothetical protein [Candidatus Pacearchaeota archaeon]